LKTSTISLSMYTASRSRKNSRFFRYKAHRYKEGEACQYA